MTIVAAGVHRPGILRCVRRGALLLERQGVHVGAEQNRALRVPRAGKEGAYTGLGYARTQFWIVRAKDRGNTCSRSPPR